MSPMVVVARAALEGFPRVSGDEPYKFLRRREEGPFSPRERG